MGGEGREGGREGGRGGREGGRKALSDIKHIRNTEIPPINS